MKKKSCQNWAKRGNISWNCLSCDFAYEIWRFRYCFPLTESGMKNYKLRTLLGMKLNILKSFV